MRLNYVVVGTGPRESAGDGGAIAEKQHRSPCRPVSISRNGDDELGEKNSARVLGLGFKAFLAVWRAGQGAFVGCESALAVLMAVQGALVGLQGVLWSWWFSRKAYTLKISRFVSFPSTPRNTVFLARAITCMLMCGGCR